MASKSHRIHILRESSRPYRVVSTAHVLQQGGKEQHACTANDSKTKVSNRFACQSPGYLLLAAQLRHTFCCELEHVLHRFPYSCSAYFLQRIARPNERANSAADDEI